MKGEIETQGSMKGDTCVDIGLNERREERYRDKSKRGKGK